MSLYVIYWFVIYVIGSDGFGIKTWQKITISAILFVVAGTCGIIFGLQKMPDGNEDEPASMLLKIVFINCGF